MPRRGQVGALAIGQQVERLAQRVLDVAEGSLGSFDVAFGLLGLGREPLLLFAQQVYGHRAGVVGVQQLLALGAQLGEARSLPGRLRFGLLAHPGHRLAEFLAHRLSLFARQLHLPVGALHRRLDQVDRDVGLLAARSSGTAQAVEVGIASAVALRVGEADAGAAVPAVKGALQVVVVLAILLEGVGVGRQHRLCFGEGRLVDQGLVAALVLDPGVADDAYVIGVLQQVAEL